MTSKCIMGADDIRRALVRIAHEVVERNRGADDLVLVGIHTRGVPLANRLANTMPTLENAHVPVNALDIGLYRDDVSRKLRPSMHPSRFLANIDGKKVVLVDDVLYTGRSVRAAMDALTDFGRPVSIQLAALIDRGHREVPIRADYVGKNVPTSLQEQVQVYLSEVDGTDEVLLLREASGNG